MSATQNHLKGFVMIHMNAQILLAPINAFAQLVLFKLRILNVFVIHFLWLNVRTEVVWFSFILSVKLFENPQKFKGMVAMLMNVWISTNVWT